MRTSLLLATATVAASAALASLACSGEGGGPSVEDVSPAAPPLTAPRSDGRAAAGAPGPVRVGAEARDRAVDLTGITSVSPPADPPPRWSLSTDAFAVKLDPGGNLDLLTRSGLTEVDAEGRVLWDVGWGAPAGEVRTAGSFALTDSGAVVVGGDFARDDGSRGAFARAFDTSGSLAWDRTWAGGAFVDLDARAHVVAVLASDQTHVLDCDGAPLWNAAVTGTVARVGLAGNVHVGATDALFQRSITTFRAADGAPLWTLRLDDSTLIRTSLLAEMIVDGEGNLYVTGYRRYRRDPREDTGQFQSIAAKIAPDGAVRWRHDTDIEATYAVVVDAAGRVTVAGTNLSVNTGYRGLHVVQYEPDGQERWQAWRSLSVFGRPGLALAGAGTVLTAATYDTPVFTETVAYDPDGAQRRLANADFNSNVVALRASAAGIYVLIAGALVAYAAP